MSLLAAVPVAPARAPDPALPRSHGALAVAVSTADAVRPARLDRLRQAGCLKLRFPGAGLQRAGCRQGVMINTSGGLTGGDRLSVAATARAGAGLALTTQTAERIYRARCDTARVANHLKVEAGARLSWLPQETILFDGGALERRLDVDAEAGARFLLCEAVILGRKHMGETVRTAHLRETWRVRVDGRLVFADAQRFDGAFERFDATAAALGGDRAFAIALLKHPGAEALVAPIRECLSPCGGASLIADDLLVLRLKATDGAALRRRLVPALEMLAGEALPRVWSL